MKSLLRNILVAVFVLLPGWSAWSAPVIEVQLRVVDTPSNDEILQLPASVSSVCVSGQVFAEVWVRSVEPASPGIAGGTVDVGFTSVVAPWEIDHGSVFTELTTGTVDAVAGVVADLGGNTLMLGAGAAPQWALLARVSFVPTMLGDAVFSLNPGSLRFALSGGQPPLDFATDVLFGPAQILAIGSAGIPGDFDCGGQVDLADFAVMQACLAGPGVPSSACDANADGDTDLADFADFQVAFAAGGPRSP